MSMEIYIQQLWQELSLTKTKPARSSKTKVVITCTTQQDLNKGVYCDEHDVEYYLHTN